MAIIRSGDLDRLITFQREAPKAGFTKAGQGEPIVVAADVPAQVQEVPPSRGERLADGLTIAARPARIRIRYRGDIDASMQILYAGRLLKIMGSPIELGRREGLEMMAQDFSTTGNPS